jgi:hypothetical protein
MKKVILILVMILLFVGCTKVDISPPVMNLGVQSKSTNITKITPALTTGNITVEYAVTTGSKYSVQIVPFGSEDPVKKFGLTAESDIVVKNYDLSSLPNGDYDLIFIDVKGTEIKRSITIKK